MDGPNAPYRSEYSPMGVCPDGENCSHATQPNSVKQSETASSISSTSFTESTPPPAPPQPQDPLCEGFPNTSSVLLVMKTGASEAFARVPTQLMTNLRCLDDFLIFSDMEQDIAGFHIYDSLDKVLPEARSGNPDFDIYRRQQWCFIDQDSCNKLGDPAKEGWSLDKYKNIHIAEKTWAMRPNYDWYLFVDADTYVVWSNLMQWLSTMDPNKKLYLGSVALIGNFPFGHGGSGYIVSRAAMEEFVGKHPGVGNEFDVRARKECCGDYLFAVAMENKTGIKVQHMWPTINGEKPFTLPYGPSHWCHPIVTMHHLNSDEINSFFNFERKFLESHPPGTTILMRDIYEHFLAPNLLRIRADWDNLADNRFYLDLTRPGGRSYWDDWMVKRMKKDEELNEMEKNAHLSFEACENACRSVSEHECFTFRYQNGMCAFGNAFKIGKPVKRDDTKGSMMSGWLTERISEWIQKQGECKVKWPTPEYKD